MQASEPAMVKTRSDARSRGRQTGWKARHTGFGLTNSIQATWKSKISNFSEHLKRNGSDKKISVLSTTSQATSGDFGNVKPCMSNIKEEDVLEDTIIGSLPNAPK